ncbi:TetR/AcrR family transcriptional regulator [Hydrogenophaga sp. 5NK40-0174]|uniref:TetR/AcrR family transcriptional regulator n=1 Tax=Hydrogenophaga sp. 5NK40-0174 TaxID=3127649 RepID=UPI00310C850D
MSSLIEPELVERGPQTKERRRTQEERRAEAESRLLASAVKLLGQKGVAGTTLSEIGVHAGYSRGLVAHHYGNKERFLRAVATYIAKVYRSKLPPEGLTNGGIQPVLDYVDAYVAEKGEPLGAVVAMFSEALISGGPLKADMLALNDVSIDYLAGIIRLGKKTGEIREDIDPEAMAVMIIGMLRGVSAQYALNLQRPQRTDVARQIKRSLFLTLASDVGCAREVMLQA